MSETAVEIAEREAEEAEQEYPEPEPEEDEPGEPEPEPDVDDDPEMGHVQPPEPPSDKAAEKALRTIERAGDVYARKVASVQATTPLGLVECPLCPVPGYVPEGGAGDASPEQVAVVLRYLGVEQPPEYPDSPHFHACEPCAGFGFVATGSKRQGYMDVDCPACLGTGYVDARHERELDALRSPEGQLVSGPPATYNDPTYAPPAPSTVTQGGYSFMPLPGAASDPHGRLAGHPLWGREPEAGGL